MKRLFAALLLLAGAPAFADLGTCPVATTTSLGCITVGSGLSISSAGVISASGGGGSVTSVALADGSTTPIFTISGSPITGSGTLTETLATQSANTVFAGPTTGSAAQPAFRALVSADIPNNAANTSGNATTSTTAVNVTGGANGSILYQTAAATTTALAIGSSTNLLTVSGGIPAWEAIPTWNQNTTGTSGGLSGTPAIAVSTLSTSGLYTANLGITATGATSNFNASSNFGTNINTGTSTGNVTVGNNTSTTAAQTTTFSGADIFTYGTGYSAATWGTTSPVWNITAATLNDTTTGSGGVAIDSAYSIQAPTFTNTQGTANVLATANTLYIAAPICGSGWTPCTNLNSLSLGGALRSAGLITGVLGANISGALSSINANSNFASNLNTGSSSGALNLANGTGNNAVGVGNGTGIVSVGGPLVSANVNSSQFTVASGTGACATSSTVVGGVQVGSFKCTGTTGASTATLTLKAATNGYSCWGRDVTTATTLTQTGAVSTTSVTLTMTAVATSDVIQFGCMGY